MLASAETISIWGREPVLALDDHVTRRTPRSTHPNPSPVDAGAKRMCGVSGKQEGERTTDVLGRRMMVSEARIQQSRGKSSEIMKSSVLGLFRRNLEYVLST